MNRQDLIQLIAAQTKSSKVASSQFLDSFVLVVTEALLSGEKVKLAGFGTFESFAGRPRKGRNLRTGEAVFIGPISRPRFTASLMLRQKFPAIDSPKRP